MGEGAPTATLRWRTGAIGCLLPLLAAAALLFGMAAVRPSLAAELAAGRRGGLVDAVAGLTLGGINVPLAVLALYLAWELFRFGWRWADEVAVAATPQGLVPHRSTLMRPIPWSRIREVRIERSARVPLLIVLLRDGGSRGIRGVEMNGDAVERFLAYARERTRGLDHG